MLSGPPYPSNSNSCLKQEMDYQIKKNHNQNFSPNYQNIIFLSRKKYTSLRNVRKHTNTTYYFKDLIFSNSFFINLRKLIKWVFSGLLHFSKNLMEKSFLQGTMPLMQMASSEHTSSHLRHPKQASSSTTSMASFISLKQRTR